MLVAASFAGGCNNSPPTAQVSGAVLYKDGTVPKGGVCAIQFMPAADSTAQIRKATSGSIGPDGKFTMYTRKEGDGVYLGSYDVTFSVWPSVTEPRSLIKDEYTNKSTTPYHVKVEVDTDDLKFELEPVASRPAAR